LSPRDRRLIEQLLDGRTNDEIAVALGVTRKTIEPHLGRLFERFAVASRTELAVRAEGEGWLGLPPLNRVSRQ
jgi:DNA-binding NarL/FixJ family response regulator